MLCAPFIPAAVEGSAIDPSALPDVWRASQLAVSRATTCTTGHAMLDAELPNGGWPRSSLVEILIQQQGIGELQLLKPVLSRLSEKQHIALVQPPYIPHAMACHTWGIDTARMLWMRAQGSGDALWTTEQVLKNGSCGAVILWQTNVRAESLRRLNLAAQSTDTWFWLMRPMACSDEPSPAPLRLGLRPAFGGVSVDILKRRGPAAADQLFIPLADMPVGRHPSNPDHAVFPQPLPAIVARRSVTPVLV